MKKLIIATSILFAFSSAFAQKPNVKPKVSKYQSKTADAKPSQSTPASSQAKPNVKPVGPSTKPAPVVKPTKASRPVGTSSTRASMTSDGTANKKNPAKLETKDNSRTISNSKVSQPAVDGRAAVDGIDAEYCKGWNDGFSKAFPKSKRIPNCENNGKCKGYKCGYEAGMNKAELLMK